MRPLLLAWFACLVAVGCGRRVAPPVAAPEIVGKVVNADGPVPAANVRLQATPHHTTTDADGIFRIPNISEVINVTAWKEGSFIGFSQSNAVPLEILLKPLPTKDDAAYKWVDPCPSDKRRPKFGAMPCRNR